MLKTTKPVADPRCPTFLEGWQASAMGWPLYAGHSFQYREGWFAREAKKTDKEKGR